MSQDVEEVFERVVAIEDGTADDRVKEGSILSGMVRSGKEPVFSSESEWPDPVFDQVIVYLEVSVKGISTDSLPSLMAVMDGLANGRFGQDFGIFGYQPAG